MEKQFLRKALLILSCISMLLISSTVFAATHVVPGKFSSIQEAIDAAVDGDVISVRPGIYYENLTIGAKSITVKSMNGPGQTILDGGKKEPVVNIYVLGGTAPAATWSPIIDGFTIQNGDSGTPVVPGYTSNFGAGVSIFNGVQGATLSVTINNCNITNNNPGPAPNATTGAPGNAVGSYAPPNGCRAITNIYNSTISNNTGEGVALYAQCSSYNIDKTNFVNNKGFTGAIHANYLANITVTNSYFSGNTATGSGGAISTNSWYPQVNVFNSVFDLNTAAVSGGVMHANGVNGSRILMNGCTLTRNIAPVGGSISQGTGSVVQAFNTIIYGNSTAPSFADLGNVSIQFSDIEGGFAGTGNIDADPMFVNALARNYQLSPGSPAIDSGSNGYGTDMFGVVRPAGGAYDMGAYEVEVPDTQTPVSAATVSGTVGANGSYTSDVTINITAQDNIAVKEVHYIINGTETVVAGGTASITLSANGTYAISYFAIDTADNVETAHLTSVTIDKTPPDTTAPVSSAAVTGVAGNNGYYKSDVTINITTQDNISVKEVHYIVNGTETVVAGGAASVSLTADGTYAISYFAVDTAGNAEAAHAISIKIDKTAPTVSSTYPTNNATGVSTSASISVTFSENILQGSAFSNITLKRGTSTVSSSKSISGNKLTIRPSSSMSSSSTYTVTIPASAVKDSAGNNGAQYSFTFKTR